MKNRPILWVMAGALLIVTIMSLLVSCGGTSTTAPGQASTTAIETPHILAGRENCLLCHETGIGGAKAIPADHAGRSNDTCVACHKPGS